MKKTLPGILAILLFMSFPAYSQKTWEIGARFLPQAPTFRYTQGIDPLYDFLKITAPYYFRVRTAQGIGVTYNVSRNLHFGADLIYSLQGGGYKQRKTNLNYIKLPLLIGYHTSTKRKVVFTVQSGLEGAYLASAHVKYMDGKKENIRSSLNTFNWGISFAMGFKFRLLGRYFITTQAYVYTDINPIAKTNSVFGVYNYIYPGLRLSIDQPLTQLLKKK